MSNMPTIPGYAIKRRIGKGGMGEVYVAEQTSLGRQVAMKVMLASLGERDEHFSDRFEREAKTTASLRHPNIITVYDSGEYGGRCYMTMDFIEGGSLRDHIGELTHKQIFRICAGVTAGLAKAHASGFVHRDIKPENILMELTGNPVITDFGIVKVTYSTTELTGTHTVGSPTYMSPEQLMGDAALDGRADLYSLGVVLFEMLEGHPPFQSEGAYGVGMKHLNEDPPPLSPKNGLFQPIVSKLLEKDPDDRFQSAGELVTAMRGIRRDVGRAVPVRKPVAADRPARASSPDDVATVVRDRSSDERDTAVRTPVRKGRKAAFPPPAEAEIAVDRYDEPYLPSSRRATRKLLSEAPVADPGPTRREPTFVGRLLGAWPVKLAAVLALAWVAASALIPDFSINNINLELRALFGAAAERQRIATRLESMGFPRRARYWLRKAAEDGHPGASFQLGMSYGSSDEGLAIEAFESERRLFSDDSWDLPADLMLAETLCNGRSVENCRRAIRVLERVVDRYGDPRAMLKLAEIYMERLDNPDYAKALGWLERMLPEIGNSPPPDPESTRAMIRLADLYDHGHGVEQDPAMATRLLALAAGSPVASDKDIRAAKQRCAELDAASEACRIMNLALQSRQ